MTDSEKFWDEKAINFDENAKKFEATSIKMVELTKKHLSKSDFVLDFGCATGTITNKFSDKAQKILGIDISSKMINIARKNMGAGNSNNITFQQATIFKTGHKKEVFNVVLAFNMLHLLETPQKVVRQINELLKPGGLFISATRIRRKNTPFPDSTTDKLRKFSMVPNVQLLEFTDLDNLITSEGFQIIESEDLEGTPVCYFIVAKKIK